MKEYSNNKIQNISRALDSQPKVIEQVPVNKLLPTNCSNQFVQKKNKSDISNNHFVVDNNRAIQRKRMTFIINSRFFQSDVRTEQRRRPDMVIMESGSKYSYVHFSRNALTKGEDEQEKYTLLTPKNVVDKLRTLWYEYDFTTNREINSSSYIGKNIVPKEDSYRFDVEVSDEDIKRFTSNLNAHITLEGKYLQAILNLYKKPLLDTEMVLDDVKKISGKGDYNNLNYKYGGVETTDNENKSIPKIINEIADQTKTKLAGKSKKVAKSIDDVKNETFENYCYFKSLHCRDLKKIDDEEIKNYKGGKWNYEEKINQLEEYKEKIDEDEGVKGPCEEEKIPKDKGLLQLPVDTIKIFDLNSVPIDRIKEQAFNLYEYVNIGDNMNKINKLNINSEDKGRFSTLSADFNQVLLYIALKNSENVLNEKLLIEQLFTGKLFEKIKVKPRLIKALLDVAKKIPVTEFVSDTIYLNKLFKK